MTADRARRVALPDHLPPPRGRWLTLYAMVWAGLALLAFAVGAYNTGAAFQPQSEGWLNLGIRSDFASRYVALVPGEQARAQRVEIGDAIVAVDGVPVERLGRDYATLRRALRRPEGTVVALTLRDAHGTLVTHRLTYTVANLRAAALGDRFRAVTRLLDLAALLGASVLLVRQRRQPVAALLALAFPCMVIGLGGNQAFGIWFGTAFSPVFFLNVGSLLLLLALLGFPDGELRSRVAKGLAVAASCWLAMATVLVLVHSQKGIATACFALLLIAAVVHVSLRYRTMAVRERQQVRWALLGMIFYALLATIYIAGIVAPPSDVNPMLLTIIGDVVGLLAITSLVGGLVISLLRYRLYDADAVIGRSAVYGVLTLGFVALFAGGEKVIEVVGERWFGEELGALAAGLGAALAAVLVVPLHHRVSHWAEHRFQKALIRLKQDLPLLVGDLREAATPAAIADAALDLGVPAVHGTRGAVLAGGTVLAALGVEPDEVHAWRAGQAAIGTDTVHDLFPTRIALGAADDAWLLLGPRPDGTPVGKDERDALVDVAGPLARALTVAGERVGREQALAAVLTRIEARLDALEHGAIGRTPLAVAS